MSRCLIVQSSQLNFHRLLFLSSVVNNLPHCQPFPSGSRSLPMAMLLRQHCHFQHGGLLIFKHVCYTQQLLSFVFLFVVFLGGSFGAEEVGGLKVINKATPHSLEDLSELPGRQQLICYVAGGSGE